MSEQEGMAAGAAPDHGGAMLRRAREQAGLHIATLAATLKVPVQRLEALEQGRYDALPDATFVRALALSVCRVLKVDAAPVLAALPSGKAPELVPSAGTIGATMPREPVAPGFGGTGESSGRRTPLWIALGLVVLAAALWYGLPQNDLTGDEVVTLAAVAPPSAPMAEPAPAVTVEPTPAAEPAQALAEGAPAPVPTDAATAPSTPAADAASVPNAPSAQATAVALRLQVQATSWVQVVGASGRVWLQRSLQPGEVVSFQEDLPLAVTVGRADATAVTVRGQPLDLAPLARNNVARFEVR